MIPGFLSRFLPREATGSRYVDTLHHGLGMTVATDARGMLAVNDPTATGDPFPIDIFGKLLDWAVPADAIATDLWDLWSWLGPLKRDLCPECRGLGNNAYQGNGENGVIYCESCDGQRWVWPTREDEGSENDAAEVVSICEYAFDRNLLCWWLAGELENYGTDCRVFVSQLKPSLVKENGILVIAAERWRLCLMSMIRDDVSKYRQYLPRAGLWTVAAERDDVAKLAAQDYYEDLGITGVRLFQHQATLEKPT
jgi:hypothetical protein